MGNLKEAIIEGKLTLVDDINEIAFSEIENEIELPLISFFDLPKKKNAREFSYKNYKNDIIDHKNSNYIYSSDTGKKIIVITWKDKNEGKSTINNFWPSDHKMDINNRKSDSYNFLIRLFDYLDINGIKFKLKINSPGHYHTFYDMTKDFVYYYKEYKKFSSFGFEVRKYLDYPIMCLKIYLK